MSYAGRMTWDYVNTTTDLKVGNGVKQTATEGQIDLSAATTDLPLGISIEDVAKAPAAGGPFQSPSIETKTGVQLKMVASTGGVAINVTVTSDSTGRFTACTKGGTQTQTDYVWGRSLQAVSNGNEVFAGIFNWFEMEIT